MSAFQPTPSTNGYSRRLFLKFTGMATGGLMLPACGGPEGDGHRTAPGAPKRPALIRVAFLYPPSANFTNDPDGWWSWPGNDFDAEGRHRAYAERLRQMEKRLGVRLSMDDPAIGDVAAATKLAEDIKTNRPDGLLLVMFYNRSLPLADALLAAAEQANVPAIFYIGLGVKHGPVSAYRRPGVYFIQSLENFDAIEYGLKMIAARVKASQTVLLSITDTRQPGESADPFLGTRIRVIPFERYAAEFRSGAVGAQERSLIRRLTRRAREVRAVTPVALENATRAYGALNRLLVAERADGLAMNCLRRGMLKPCIGFSLLNAALIPAACEDDYPAMLGQMLGQLLTDRPGFQHNPCFDTEKNHYFASHCTCPVNMDGPTDSFPYVLRRFAHTNEGSCSIQVFWKAGIPVTLIHYTPGKAPSLDVYAGEVVQSHDMPPAGGCTTNVGVKITDRDDACDVRGHHNVLFCGDHARKFRLFAQLYKISLVGRAGAPPTKVPL